MDYPGVEVNEYKIVYISFYIHASMLKLNMASVHRSDRGLATEDTTSPPAKMDTRYDVPPRNRPSGIDTTIDITPAEVNDSFNKPKPDEQTWKK